jgi:exonuclease SbcC
MELELADATTAITTTTDEGGYLPLRLTLTGFKGIRSGLGRDTLTLDFEALREDASLVAIAGGNGRGKSTVMDNLHPYLVMPSRAGADGLGAFSYYDHIFLPESQKELVWAHGGRRYKTQLVFRLNGKRKTEAFLFEEQGCAWVPVSLADGTLTDGKVDTYERAVREILGPEDTFFTSVFSAQGKRPLSAFKNGEIKTLLADLLGLERIRAEGARAAETVRLLKAGLGVVRQEQAQAAESILQLGRQAAAAANADALLARSQNARKSAAAHLAEVHAAATRVEAEASASAGHDGRRAELAADRDRANGRFQESARKLMEEQQRIDQRAVGIDQRVKARKRQHVERRAQLQRQRDSLARAAAMAAKVRWAAVRSPSAVRCVGERTARLSAAQTAVDRSEALRAQVRLHRQAIEGIEREAGQLALRHADLKNRFGLAAQVPCAGMDLQGRCQLLTDAREAQTLLPSVDAQLRQLVDRKRQEQEGLMTVSAELERLAGAAERRNRAEQRLEAAQARLAALQMLIARTGEVEQAAAALGPVDLELQALGVSPVEETPEEASERAEIEAARARLAADRSDAQTALKETLARVDAALLALPPAFDTARLTAARQSLSDAQAAVRQAEQAEMDAIRQHEQAVAVQDRVAAARAAQEAADARAAIIEGELSNWTLLAKCLSNDGVIALDIDDAGPTFSALANDLLLACYGQRFTLEVVTQSATAKGEMREDFDIIVHDGLRGESKSLKLVSGGERVWINECLIRAIALYLGSNTGRRFGTLFSDEADGPLDPDHKRMFMDMKREVLRLGRYAREFYVSQTPELTAMADHVINLDAMVKTQEEQNA